MKKRRGKKSARQKINIKKAQKLTQRPWAIFGLVVLILLFAAYSISSAKISASKKHESAKLQINIVPSGFSPASLDARVGDNITWVNQDTKPHQVVADLDDNKNQVLGFDNNLVLRTGDSYSFSFIHPGQYYYHDQLSPGFSGTVVVK